MGVITGLLLLPITGPVNGFRFMLEWLHDEAEAALRDEGRAFAEMIDLSMRHSSGQLTDAEYAAQETELLERLNSIRDYRNELLHSDADEYDELDAYDPDEEYDVSDESGEPGEYEEHT
jgi:hypothetical protein